MKAIYSNSIMVSHTADVFVIKFSFEAPDGNKDSVYINLSPSGAKALKDMLSKEIDVYVKEHGDIKDEWELSSIPKCKQHLAVR